VAKEEVFATVGKMVALGRPARPEDVVRVVSFLASESSECVTGQTMVVDGGMSTPEARGPRGFGTRVKGPRLPAPFEISGLELVTKIPITDGDNKQDSSKHRARHQK